MTNPDGPEVNRGIVLRRYPEGLPRPADFELLTIPMNEPREGEVLVETAYLSMDPAPRMRMRADAKVPPPMPLNRVVAGRGVGIVRSSRNSGFQVGDAVMGELGWQEFCTLPGNELRQVDAKRGPLQTALGILGPSGITAWCLIHEAARVRPGDTVVITAAAGSVGSVATQLARLARARVVALVGGARQAAFARDQLGADAVVDHRCAQFAEELAAACPRGADVVLDSVGGSLHNDLMAHLADRARIVVFGFISSYDAAGVPPEYGRMYQIIRRRAQLSGFLVADYADRFATAIEYLASALEGGRIRGFEHVSEGLDQAPMAFAALFSGEPVGKQLVRVRAL